MDRFFIMKMKNECIFCKIVKGEIPCHKIWEDEKHLAFLSIYPNTNGFSVVIPKKHFPSYAFSLSTIWLINVLLRPDSSWQLI